MQSAHKAVFLVMVCGILLVVGSSPAVAMYATVVVEFSDAPPGTSTNVLGTPDCSNATDFNSVGSAPGFVTVAFGTTILDAAGDDVLIHLTGFQPDQPFSEAFRVLGSDNGVDFVEIGSADPDDFNFGPLDEVALGFDLAAGGLLQAIQIKVENLSVETGTNSEGPDICGFEVVVSLPMSSRWTALGLTVGLLSALGLLVSRRRMQPAKS